jgi:hypothetical protein
MNNSSIIIPESILVVDKNTVTIALGASIDGTATVMYGNVLSPLGTGILNAPLSGENNFDPLVLAFDPNHMYTPTATLSNDNKTVTFTSSSGSRSVVYSTIGHDTGKHVVEFQRKFGSNSSFVEFGLTHNESLPLTTFPTDSKTFLVLTAHDSVDDKGLSLPTLGPIDGPDSAKYMLTYDADNGLVQLIKDDIVKYSTTYPSGVKMWPLATVNVLSYWATINGGDSPFTNTIPAGYKSWDETQSG